MLIRDQELIVPISLNTKARVKGRYTSISSTYPPASMLNAGQPHPNSLARIYRAYGFIVQEKNITWRFSAQLCYSRRKPSPATLLFDIPFIDIKGLVCEPVSSRQICMVHSPRCRCPDPSLGFVSSLKWSSDAESRPLT